LIKVNPLHVIGVVFVQPRHPGRDQHVSEPDQRHALPEGFMGLLHGRPHVSELLSVKLAIYAGDRDLVPVDLKLHDHPLVAFVIRLDQATQL
jgi:hypothetical protein